MRKFSTCAAAFVVATSAAALPMKAAADSAAVGNFYKGKNITIWVGYGAGGGYDTTARLIARHYGRHVPGKPSVTVQNMPGAGSLLAANNLYNIAPKDGTVLGVFSSTAAMLPLYNDPNANFDTMKFNWIGNLHRDTLSCGVWKGAGQNIRTLEDLIAAPKTVVFGSDGTDAPLARWPLFMKNVLGANLKVIAGYKGTRGINLAMKQGEVHASCGMFESSVRSAFMQDFTSGDLTLFVQTGFNRNVELFGKATNLYSLLKTEEEIQMAKLVFGPAEITRPFAAPPGVPAERVEALRDALMEMMKDPQLKEEATKLGLELDPMSGKEIVAELQGLFRTPRSVVEKAAIMTSRR